MDRTEEFAKHIFREEHKMADTWAIRGTSGRKASWVARKKVESEACKNNQRVLGVSTKGLVAGF